MYVQMTSDNTFSSFLFIRVGQISLDLSVHECCPWIIGMQSSSEYTRSRCALFCWCSEFCLQFAFFLLSIVCLSAAHREHNRIVYQQNAAKNDLIRKMVLRSEYLCVRSVIHSIFRSLGRHRCCAFLHVGAYLWLLRWVCAFAKLWRNLILLFSIFYSQCAVLNCTSKLFLRLFDFLWEESEFATWCGSAIVKWNYKCLYRLPSLNGEMTRASKWHSKQTQ